MALTSKQLRFCQEYCKDSNATAAAIRAGYSEGTAASIGWENLRKPEIFEKITELMDELSMPSAEVVKRTTDIARSNLTDYFIKRYVPFTPQIKVGLSEVIKSRREYVVREEEFCSRMGFTEKAFDDFQKGLEDIRAQIIRLEIELENNPNAYRIIDGETEMLEQIELDLVKLSEDKEKGKIKSFKHTKDGIQVEMYSADTALDRLAKIRKLTSDKELDVNVNVETVTRIGYGDRDPDE